MRPVSPGRLLWIDCTAAAIGGVGMLALSGWLSSVFGLPRGLFVFNGLVNLAYGAYSFSLARQPSAPLGRVRALVLANFGWAGLCAGIALYFAARGTWLGAAYLLTEGVLVGALAGVEARALAALPDRRGTRPGLAR